MDADAVPEPIPPEPPQVVPPSPQQPNGPTWPERIVRRIYTSNPFYVISCALVLFGLIRSFQGDAIATHAWTLLGLLASYTLLLAGTAFVLIRWGRVWDDARTILLLVVLLLLGLSVSFDKLLVPDPALGRRLLLAGWIVSVLISEGLLWGLGIRLGAAYRIPYYLLLTLFFGYPLTLVNLTASDTVIMSWRVLGFAVLAAGIFLLLLPAARRGSTYVEQNGTPRSCPKIPMSMFVYLAVAVCLRTWLLGISFVPALQLNSSFGLYFLTPLAVALNLLLLEGSRGSTREAPRLVALVTPVLWIVMSQPDSGADRVYTEFLAEFLRHVGSPFWLAVWAMAAFYGYAEWRKLRHANLGLIAALLLATFVTPQTINLAMLAEQPHLLPAVLVAVIQLVRALRRPTVWREFLAGTLAVFALWAVLNAAAWEPYQLLVPVHAWLVFLIVLGGRYSDAFAQTLRVAAMLGLVFLSILAVHVPRELLPAAPSWLPTGYVLALVLSALLAARWQRDRGYVVSAVVILFNQAVSLVHGTYLYLAATVIGPGLDLMLAGAVCFVLAAVLSLSKAGLLQRAGRMMRGTE